ncbi:MAG TPA: 23S rRNA (pseudouridine(1915)-N(3))-methyltransferase RlmH [Candidatus Binatus sp.]|nr:23S rRNA (pseudouridine(1915)-N(3))-methyltransferase RlmH [Candidatus Binatus sp.]
MNVTLLAVDKMREPYLRDGCDRMIAKLKPHMPVSVVEIKPQTIDEEARAMIARIADGSIVWALDREGEALSSTQLARRIATVQQSGRRRLTLLIGGAEGLGTAVLERADLRWSLSRLTFLHEMARLIALEQLYRAIKINRGEPYHR